MTETEPQKGVPPESRLPRTAVILLPQGLLVGLFFWTGLAQSWQLRLTGSSSTATIRITGTCVEDDDTMNTYVYDFTDLASGQHYTLIDPNSCTDLYQDGQVVQLWYTLGQQSHVLTDVAAQQLYWMTAVGAVLALVLMGLVLRQLLLLGLQGHRHTPSANLYVRYVMAALRNTLFLKQNGLMSRFTLFPILNVWRKTYELVSLAPLCASVFERPLVSAAGGLRHNTACYNQFNTYSCRDTDSKQHSRRNCDRHACRHDGSCPTDTDWLPGSRDGTRGCASSISSGPAS